jgi:uncharacterized membrane protein (DUF485 family)
MTKQKQAKDVKSNSFECFMKDLFLVVVIVVWIAAILANYFKESQIPNSVEIGFTMALGYLLGDKVVSKFTKK